MKSRLFWFMLCVSAAASVFFLWGTDVPLGVAGDPNDPNQPYEWTWERIRIHHANSDDLLAGWALAGIGIIVYAGFAFLGAKRLTRCSRTEVSGWLAGLVIVGFAWLWIVQESCPAGYRMSKAVWVLYYPGSSGYFTEARYHMTDVSSFLSTYEDRMAEGDVLHVGTHPPGLFLFYRALLSISQSSSGLREILSGIQPDSVDGALTILEQTSRATATPLEAADNATIWLAALLTQFAVVTTVIPLFFLLRRDYSRETSWLAVSLWPLVPALAVFLPKSDAFFPLLGTAFLFVWLEAWQRQSVVWSLAAGLLLWLGMFFSLAVLPIALLAGLLALWESRLSGAEQQAEHGMRRAIVVAGSAAAGLIAVVVVLRLVFHVNMFNVWIWNYRNHAGFYDQFPRTYWKWLLVNPLELTMAVGLPVFVLAVASYCKSTKADASWRDKRCGPLWCCLAVWILLWLSGKNMGEAARLWIVLMPLIIWLSARSLQATTDAPRRRLTGWLVVLLLQALVCAATVSRVDGFHLNRRMQTQQQFETAERSVGFYGFSLRYQFVLHGPVK